MSILYIFSKLILVFGIINVWLVRYKKETAYRGSDSKNLKDEFLAYGYPVWFFYVIGFLKLCFAALVFLDFWLSVMWLRVGAFGLLGLMVGAVFSHLKVKDTFKKYLPATVMLLLSFFVLSLSFFQR